MPSNIPVLGIYGALVHSLNLMYAPSNFLDMWITEGFMSCKTRKHIHILRIQRHVISADVRVHLQRQS
jgi:hypothetical protein